MDLTNELFGLAKEKLRVDEGDEALILLHVKSAMESLKLSGVPESESSLYKTAVLIQVILDYENNDKDLNVNALKQSLETIILKLKTFGGEKNEI